MDLHRLLSVASLAALASTPASALQIAAGDAHNLLVRDDGTLWVWGHNYSGQLGDGSTINRAAPFQLLSTIKSASGGINHSMAIRNDGALLAWGANYAGQLGDGTTRDRVVPVQTLPDAIAVAAGFEHTLAIRRDSSLWSWGANDLGQLGDGTDTQRITPGKIMAGVRAVGTGYYHAAAIRTDDTLWTWGGNYSGQVGNGSLDNRLTPVQVLSGVRSIAVGHEHTLALLPDGRLLAWGANYAGQIGDGTEDDRAAPVQVLTGVKAIAAGGYYSLAIKNDGTLWTWGGNDYGQLGDGSTTDRSLPSAVMSDVAMVAAGLYHTVVVKTDGSLWAWGGNIDGQLGDGSTVNRPTPVTVHSGVRAVGAGFEHTITVRNDGSLWTWGANYAGQLGDGGSSDRPAPLQVFSGVQSVVGGYYHTLALANDGTLFAWGGDDYGQLGDGGDENQNRPRQVMIGVQSMAAGVYHSLAVRSDGTLWTWGRNEFGQLGDGTTMQRALPAQVMSGVRAASGGRDHTLALKADGTVWAWGANYAGQLGDGTKSNRTTPVQVLSDVKAIAAGYDHSIALKNDGSVWGWGANDYGQVGDGSLVDRTTPARVLGGATAIAAGVYHSLALSSDGSVWAWGTSSYALQGPFSFGPQLSPRRNLFLRNITAIAAGGHHAIAVEANGNAYTWGSNIFQEAGIARLSYRTSPFRVLDPVVPYANADLVVEFFNATIRNGANQPGIGHYFITAAGAEQISIDQGGSGEGWTRTGRTFRAWNDPAKAPAGAVGVCRFYAREPNSHFYTASADECQSLRNQNPTNNALLGWAFEEIAFYTLEPDGGNCPAGYFPVYRSYNNRFGPPASNDGNHRLTPSYNDYQRSIRFLGYVDEQVAFCSPSSPSPGGDLQVTYAYPGTVAQSGNQVAVELLFSNNGAGQADGGSIYAVLPEEVANWSIVCTPRRGASCPATPLTADALRTGVTINAWPAGGGLTITATGTAPHVAAGGDATLNFVATIATASGSPDPVPANDTPPIAQTVVKTANVCNVVANAASISASAALETTHLNIIAGSGCAWSVQSSVPWLTVTPSSGTGDTTVALSIGANGAVAERSGELGIGSQAIRVRQSGVPCTFVVTPNQVNTGAGESSTTLMLAAPAGCAWEARSSSNWTTITPASGTGAAALTLTVAANPAPLSRNASVAIGSQVVPIAQAGAAETAVATPAVDACASLRLSREGDQVAAGGLSGPLGVGVIVDVGCDWQAENTEPWLTITAGGFGRGSGVISYLVAPYFDINPRNGRIVVAAKGVRRTFTINQIGVPAESSSGDGGGDGGGGSGGGSGGGAG